MAVHEINEPRGLGDYDQNLMRTVGVERVSLDQEQIRRRMWWVSVLEAIGQARGRHNCETESGCRALLGGVLQVIVLSTFVF